MFGYSSKQIGTTVVISIIFIFLLGALFGDSQPLPPPQPQNTVSENTSSQQKEVSPPTKVNDGTVLVTRVIDGDTIEIEGGQKIRYIGIDTPETVDPRKPVQCFGTEASNRNKQLVGGKRVRLEKDVSETDRYGRLVRYVYVGDTFVNLVLVQDGFATSYTYPPDVKYQNQFTEAERLAREQKKGLWGSCPISAPTSAPITTPPPSQIPPQEPTASPQPPSCTIKGNINSSGEKIYHVVGCGSYSQTKIDEPRGERWFCTEEEAVAAGWRKAKNCP